MQGSEYKVDSTTIEFYQDLGPRFEAKFCQLFGYQALIAVYLVRTINTLSDPDDAKTLPGDMNIPKVRISNY